MAEVISTYIPPSFYEVSMTMFPFQQFNVKLYMNRVNRAWTNIA